MVEIEDNYTGVAIRATLHPIVRVADVVYRRQLTDPLHPPHFWLPDPLNSLVRATVDHWQTKRTFQDHEGQATGTRALLAIGTVDVANVFVPDRDIDLPVIAILPPDQTGGIPPDEIEARVAGGLNAEYMTLLS